MKKKSIFFLLLSACLLFLSAFSSASGQELNDPFSFALFGDSGKMQIKEDVTISGNVFQNGDVEIKKNVRIIDGELFATGDVTIKEDAQVTQGTLPDPLPQFPEFDTGFYDNLLDQAHVQPEEDKTFEDIALNGDTLFINGKMTLKKGGAITGPGVIVATEEIKIKEDSFIGPDVTLISSKKLEIKKNTTMEQGVLFSREEVKIDEECDVSANIRSLKKVEIKKDVTFNGLIITPDKVTIKEDSNITGIIIAGKEIEVKKNTVITFDSSVNTSCADDTTLPEINITSPLDGQIINTTTPLITIEFSDDICGIDTASFSARINNVESSDLFTVTGTDATFQVAADLPAGENVITASISDLGGNTANTDVTFTIEIPLPTTTTTMSTTPTTTPG